MANNESDDGARRLDGQPATVTITAPPARLWQTYSYASEWFSDGAREAQQSGHTFRRREIVFAVCAAETYLFEWVRDVVLKHDFEALPRYFPTGRKRGAIEKFKQIPKELATEGLISSGLDCGGAEFAAFRELVAFRDGLVHARASRPDTSDLSAEARRVPSKGTLDALPAGWAVGVVRALLAKLHADTNTRPAA